MEIKNTLKDFKKGLTIGAGFTISLGIISISYATFSTITQVSNGQTLSANTFNTLITNQEELKNRLDAINTKQIASAWVNFNGTSCTGGAGNQCTINDSYNVTNVIRDSVGRYTINFTTPLNNTNYAVIGDNLTTADLYNSTTYKEKNINYTKIGSNAGGSPADYSNFSVLIFGGKN